MIFSFMLFCGLLKELQYQGLLVQWADSGSEFSHPKGALEESM